MGRATPLGRKGSLLHRKKKWGFASIRRRTYTWLIHALAVPRAAFKFQIVRRIHLSWSVYDKLPLSHRTRRVVRSASPRLASPRVPLKIEETGVSEKGENSKGDFWEAVDGRRSIALDRRFPPAFPIEYRGDRRGIVVAGRETRRAISREPNLSRDRLIFLQSIATIHSSR